MAVALALVNAPTGADRDAIQRPLIAYNAAKAGPAHYQPARSGPVSSLLSGEQIFEIEIGVTGRIRGLNSRSGNYRSILVV
jgi:hypothetical protein